MDQAPNFEHIERRQTVGSGVRTRVMHIQYSTIRERLLAVLRSPAVFYYLLRIMICLPAAVVLITGSAPEKNLQFGPVLVVYALALGVAAGTAYMLILRSHRSARERGIRSHPPRHFTIAVGAADMVGGLLAVYLSGGWGSPFWHASLTTLIIPCFVLRMRWSVVIALAYVCMHSVTLALAGDGLMGEWLGEQRYLYVASLISACVICVVIGYLGHVYREMDRQRLAAQAALRDLDTVGEVGRSVSAGAVGVEELTQRMAQTIGERHAFGRVSIYLSGDGEDGFRLAASAGSGEEQAPTTDRQIVSDALSTSDLQVVRRERSWTAAIPIRGERSPLGVLLLGSDDDGGLEQEAERLGRTLVGQMAVAIENADLRRPQPESLSPHQQASLRQEAHEEMANSMWGLMLGLEAAAELARRADSPLTTQLRELVTGAKHMLSHMRHFIFGLQPLVEGERSLSDVVDSHAREFQMLTGIQTQLRLEGECDGVPGLVSVGVCRILQECLSNVLWHSSASSVGVDLAYRESANIRLVVSDDGVGFDSGAGNRGRGIEEMQRWADELGGGLQITSSVGRGTRVTADLPIGSGLDRLDSGDNH